MHERERWQKILVAARGGGVVRARDLVALTGASPATLRRDLLRLEEAGKLRRVHGGAQAAVPGVATSLGGTQDDSRKRAIGRLAASLCNNGDSIIINAGSTTWYMVEHVRHLQMQILTNSVPISHELISTSANRVVLPGGEVYREQGIILSPFDDDAIQHFTASMMFMSCHALTSMGVIEADPLVARAEAKLLARAERLIVMVDSSKFMQRGSMAVCGLAQVHTLITDAGIPLAMREALDTAGVRLMIAEAE